MAEKRRATAAPLRTHLPSASSPQHSTTSSVVFVDTIRPPMADPYAEDWRSLPAPPRLPAADPRADSAIPRVDDDDVYDENSWTEEAEDGTIVRYARDHTGHYRPPFPVKNYTQLHSGRFDAWRFGEMRQNGDQLYIRDDRGHRRETRTLGWMKRWRHWGGRGAMVCRTSSRETDMPFVRCEEESVYESRLSAFVQLHIEAETVPAIDENTTSFSFPYDKLYFFDNFSYWLKDVDFEVRHRSRNSSARVLLGWHNVEFAVIPPHSRREFFVASSDFVQSEPSRWLNVPTPPVFAYYTGYAVRKGGDAALDWEHRPWAKPHHRRVVFAIARVEFAILSFIAFLRTCDFGSPDGWGLDPRVPKFDGIIVPITGQLRSDIQSIGVLNIARGTKFNAAAALIAFKRTTEDIDWLRVPGDVDLIFLPYDFESGTVSPLEVSSYVYDSQKRQVPLPAVPSVPWVEGHGPRDGEWREARTAMHAFFHRVEDRPIPVVVNDESCADERVRLAELRRETAERARAALQEITDQPVVVDIPDDAPMEAQMANAALDAARGAAAETVTQLQADLAGVREELEAANATVAQLRGELSTEREERAADAATHRGVIDERDAATTALADLRAETDLRINQLRERVASLEGTCTTLRETVAARDASVDALTEARNGLRGRVAENERLIARHDRSIARLRHLGQSMVTFGRPPPRHSGPSISTLAAGIVDSVSAALSSSLVTELDGAWQTMLDEAAGASDPPGGVREFRADLGAPEPGEAVVLPPRSIARRGRGRGRGRGAGSAGSSSA